MERSAEWLRGAVESHINTCNLITSITSATKSHPARQGLLAAGNELHNQLDRYRALLAEAEAREASVPTAAECELGDYYLDQEVAASAGTAGTLTLSETIAGLREACAGVTVSTVLEPTEADLAVADELDMLAAHIQEYIGPEDARDDIRRICRNRAEDLRRGVKLGPSAAEVIAAAKVALESVRPSHRSPGCWCPYERDRANFGHSDGCKKASKAVALAADWEAARR